MNKTVKKIITCILLSIIIIISSNYVLATVSPGDITGQIENADEIRKDIHFELEDKIIEMLRFFGIFLAVGVLMVIGIKYITASTQEKANYKKSMVPYVIGCVLIFGASMIAPQILDLFNGTTEAEDFGNIVLGIIRVVGTFIAVAVLMILGIKYMVGSTEERASYKATMLPYVIGSVLLFSAVNITSGIYNVIGPMNANYETYLSAKEEGREVGKRYKNRENSQEAFENYYSIFEESYNKAYEEDPDSEETSRLKGYLEGLKEGYYGNSV